MSAGCAGGAGRLTFAPLLALLTALLLAVGCKGQAGPARDDRGAEPPPAAEAAPRAQSALAVTLNGLAAPMASAFAWRAPGGGLDVLVSSAPLTCGEATAPDRAAAIDEVVYRTHVPAGDARVAGDGAPGAATRVTVHDQQTVDGSVHLAVDGTIDALGCPPPAIVTNLHR